MAITYIHNNYYQQNNHKNKIRIIYNNITGSFMFCLMCVCIE